MSLEIDMVDVGDADAIALRYFYPDGRIFVAIIDGGNQDDGEKIIEIVRRYYQTTHVDLVVSTHPDHDYIAGLSQVVSELDVDQVWLHDPWLHIEPNIPRQVAIQLFKSRGIENVATKSTDDLDAFKSLVDRLGIPRVEPFSGVQDGPLFVVGPSPAFYEGKLAGTDYTSIETGTTDNNETSTTNDTSSIILLQDGTQKYLFTGDAGVEALNDARSPWIFGNLHWLDVPHHGSRRNLSSELVDYLKPTTAFVSAAGTRKHPSSAAVNSLKRAGTTVYSTHKGGSKWHHEGAPQRNDYSAAVPL